MTPQELISQMDPYYALFGEFFAFANRLQTAGDTFYEEITCKQFFLAICMSLFTDEEPTPKQLAEVMGCSHQNVKVILDKMEKKGFVKITQDKTDKRKLRISLTKKMAEIGMQRKADQEQFMTALYDGISPEKAKETLETLLQIEENLKKITDARGAIL